MSATQGRLLIAPGEYLLLGVGSELLLTPFQPITSTDNLQKPIDYQLSGVQPMLGRAAGAVLRSIFRE